MKTNRKRILAITTSSLIVLPLFAFAAGLVPCGGAGEPQCDFDQFAKMINLIINWFLGLTTVVAAITFAVAGIKIFVHPENEKSISDAKAMAGKTVWGLVVILIAWLVLKAVIGALVNPSVGAFRFFQ